MFAYAAAGVAIGRTTVPQESAGTAVAGGLAAAIPGDLIFEGPPGATTHVAIYLGGGQMIEAQKTGTFVHISKVWFTPSIIRRVFTATSTAAVSVGSTVVGGPKGYARGQVPDAAQFDCLDKLWTRESGWRWNADNPGSDAYGIPQSLPGSKMASAGADWLTNPVTQITWGLSYIKGRYGSPCAAWAHSESVNWY